MHRTHEVDVRRASSASVFGIGSFASGYGYHVRHQRFGTFAHFTCGHDTAAIRLCRSSDARPRSTVIAAARSLLPLCSAVCLRRQTPEAIAGPRFFDCDRAEIPARFATFQHSRQRRGAANHSTLPCGPALSSSAVKFAAKDSAKLRSAFGSGSSSVPISTRKVFSTWPPTLTCLCCTSGAEALQRL